MDQYLYTEVGKKVAYRSYFTDMCVTIKNIFMNICSVQYFYMRKGPFILWNWCDLL